MTTVHMKCQVASLTPLHHTMLSTSFRIKKSWREGLVTTTPPSSPMRQWDRAAAGHAKLPFSVMLSEDDSHTELSCHLSIQGLQSHLRASWKVLMSHQTTWKEILPRTGYQPSVSSSLLPSAEVLFHTSPGWERGLVGMQGHWWGVLCALDIHLTCNTGAALSSEQSKGPPNGTGADVLHACVSTGLFQHFQVWFMLPWVLVYKTLLCSVQPGISNTPIPATSWFLWRGRANVWEVQVLACRKCTSIRFCTGQSACCLTKIYPIEDSPSPLRHKVLDINSLPLKTVRGKRKFIQVCKVIWNHNMESVTGRHIKSHQKFDSMAYLVAIFPFHYGRTVLSM